MMHAPRENEAAADWTTASQLAEMAFCERKLLLKHAYGPRVSLTRQAAQHAGNEEHRRFLRAAFREQPTVASSLRPPSLYIVGRTGSLWARLLDFIARFIK